LLTFYLDPDQHSPEGLEQDPYGIYLKGWIRSRIKGMRIQNTTNNLFLF
jgi:hypothetical protein